MKVLGIDHREMSGATMRLHTQVIKKMAEEQGTTRVRGIYGLSNKQQRFIVDALYPEVLKPGHKKALERLDGALTSVSKWLS